MEQKFTFHPMGYFRSQQSNKYDVGHQGLNSFDNGIVEIDVGPLTKQALEDLEGFERIWLIYVFHKSMDQENFKPKVQPPRHDTTKKSLFATRSPHRFNPIGLSAAVLEKVDGNKLYVTSTDLIDGTPILDIKPYIPEYDSFQNLRLGWLDSEPIDQWQVEWLPSSLQDLSAFASATLSQRLDSNIDDSHDLLHQISDLEKFQDIVNRQLTYRPFDKHRHRITWNDSTNVGTLSLGHWRVQFGFDPMKKIFSIIHVHFA